MGKWEMVPCPPGACRSGFVVRPAAPCGVFSVAWGSGCLETKHCALGAPQGDGERSGKAGNSFYVVGEWERTESQSFPLRIYSRFAKIIVHSQIWNIYIKHRTDGLSDLLDIYFGLFQVGLFVLFLDNRIYESGDFCCDCKPK